jgi:hypothetical protein
MDDDATVLPSQKLNKIDVAVLVADALATFFGELCNMLMAHANYMLDRRQAANEMRASIERIVTGE